MEGVWELKKSNRVRDWKHLSLYFIFNTATSIYIIENTRKSFQSARCLSGQALGSKPQCTSCHLQAASISATLLSALEEALHLERAPMEHTQFICLEIHSPAMTLLCTTSPVQIICQDIYVWLFYVWSLPSARALWNSFAARHWWSSKLVKEGVKQETQLHRR